MTQALKRRRQGRMGSNAVPPPLRQTPPLPNARGAFRTPRSTRRRPSAFSCLRAARVARRGARGRGARAEGFRTAETLARAWRLGRACLATRAAPRRARNTNSPECVVHASQVRRMRLARGAPCDVAVFHTRASAPSPATPAAPRPTPPHGDHRARVAPPGCSTRPRAARRASQRRAAAPERPSAAGRSCRPFSFAARCHKPYDAPGR